MKNYTAFLLLSITFTTHTKSEPMIFKASEQRHLSIEDFVQSETNRLITQYSLLTPQSRQAILSGAESRIKASCSSYYSGDINEHCAQQKVVDTVLQETLNMYRSYCHSQGLSGQQTEYIVHRMNGKIRQALRSYGFKAPQGFFSNYLDNMHYEIRRVQEEINNQTQLSNQQAEDKAFASGVAAGGFWGFLAGLILSSGQNPAPESAPAQRPTPSAPSYQAVTKRCNNCKNDVLPSQNNDCPVCGLPFYL